MRISTEPTKGVSPCAGAFLAASPWIFGFADESASVWVPLVIIGLAAVFLGLMTVQQGGYSYRTTRTAAG